MMNASGVSLIVKLVKWVFYVHIPQLSAHDISRALLLQSIPYLTIAKYNNPFSEALVYFLFVRLVAILSSCIRYSFSMQRR